MTSDLRKGVCVCGLAFIFVWVALSSQALAAQGNGPPGTGAEPAAQVSPATSASRQLSEEIEALRKELKEKPNDAGAIRLGQLLLQKGDLNEALQAFDDALQANPRSFEARIGKGITLGRQGEYEKAEKMLRDALALNPKPARVHYELGLLYEKRGDFDKAITEYKEGLKKF